MFRKLILLPVFFVMAGCSTMHFTHGPQPVIEDRDGADTRQWHGTTLEGMVEMSTPVNLYQNCKGKQWQQTTVEMSPRGALTSIVVSVVTAALVPILEGINLYTPWTVETYCSQFSE